MSYSDWRHFIHDLGPIELPDQELTATLTSQERPILVLSNAFYIKNIYVSRSNSGERFFWEEDWNSERWGTVHDLHCFTQTLSLAKLSIRGMMTRTCSWVNVPSDIRETVITQIASDLMEYMVNEGSNSALGYALIPCFQLHISLVRIIDDEELNFRLAAQQSFDAAQRDDVLQCRPVSAMLLESLVTEIVGEVPEDDREECVICKDEFIIGVEVKRLPCSHRFHEQCITRWFQEKNTCPLCRQSIQV